MVFVGDKKYACETCIKGHRSSSCKHTDRPLFEIKKKGRPVTQCEHCRELRKTKQVHVKCSCDSKDDSDTPLPSSSKGVKKQSASAAFPSGLPEALEASVAHQQVSESSPSEIGSTGTPASSCSCKLDGSCDCSTPRIPLSQSKKSGKERAIPRADDATIHRDSEEPNRPAGLAVIANSGHHRPVLPRPSPQRQSSPSGPLHDSSMTAHTYPGRHQSHSDHFYSPYGRAYDQAHGAELVSPEPTLPPGVAESTVASSVYSSDELYAESQQDDLPEPPPQWSDNSSPALPDFVPSLCGCGPTCACPGCIVHRGPGAQPSAADVCLNPNDCAACFECNFLSTAVNVPSLSESTDAQYQSIDEWVRQLATTTGFNMNESTAASPSRQQASSSSNILPSLMPADQLDVRYDPASWQTYALWGSLQGQNAAQSECCGGRCQCAAGMCTCTADCCGCCTGCQCPECDHPGDGGRDSGSHKTLTFAESGVRDACCGPSTHVQPQPQSPISGPSFLNISGPYSSSGQTRNDGYSLHASLTVPRTVSRASSTSSQASSHHSHSSSSSHGSIHPPASGNPPAVQSCCNSLRNISTSSPQPPPPNHVPSAADQHRTLNSSYDFVL